MNKQVIFWTVGVALFVLVVAGASFFLAGKSQEQSMDHGAHIAGDTDKLNSWVGQAAPDFALTSYDGKKFSLQELKGKKVVLFFTEGAMCYPSCWNQIVAFGRDNTFNNEDTVTLNIMVDTEGEWKKAVDKMPELGSATVLLDITKSVSREYGALSLPSSMHKGQYPGHTYLILDRNGVVRYVFDDPQMATRNDQLRAELEKIS